MTDDMDTDDDAMLVPDSVPQEVNPPGCRYRYYSLPSLRYENLVRVVLFIDAILILVLWLTGGNTKYFIDNITDFHILESTFDLALLSAAKLVFLVIMYSVLEDVSLRQIQHPRGASLSTKKNFLHAGIIIISLGTLAYAITKGSLVLHAILNNARYSPMHSTYNAMLVSSVVFGLIEVILGMMSFSAMRRLKVMRKVHHLNSNGQEIDKDGELIRRKVNLSRLLSLAKPEACLLIVATVCLFISSASTIAAPLFFGQVIDAAQKSMDSLNKTILLFFLVNLVGAVGSMLRSWLFTLAGQRLVARLRKDLFQSIICQEIAFFDQTRTGELTNRLSSDTQVIQNAITVNISMLSRYIIQILGSIILMFMLNPALTGVLLAVVPIVSIGAVQYGMIVKKLRKDFQDKLADASTAAEENISCIRTVRSFVGENKANHAYSTNIDKSYTVGKKLALVQGMFDGTIGLIAQGAITLVLWYGGKLVFEGQVTPGILTSFLLYTLQVAMAFALLSSLYGDFMQAVGASIRVFDLMDRVPKVPLEGGKVFISLQPGVDFEDVHFSYPSRADTKVLKGISFSMSPGEMVALVGRSGGGKSTVVSLIERFYDVDKGHIKIGGDDVRLLDPKWFRTHIGVVSQEPSLFACSIKENISYGRSATMEEIIDAAKQANAHDFIMSFEDGYDTLVGERGVRLSGGQKQRVAIARALLMNPSLLLLDEATSALDAESEHLVQEAIDRAMHGRTVLVIAHRLSTVRNASKVIVIDKGRKAEQGSHDELLAMDGVYKRLILQQLMANNKQVVGTNDQLIDLSTDTTGPESSRHSPVGTNSVLA